MEPAQATNSGNGPKNSNKGNGDAKSLFRDDLPYCIYFCVDFLITIALFCSCIYLRFTGDYTDETKAMIILVLVLALIPLPSGAPSNTSPFHLSLYTVRLLLLAFVAAKYGLFPSKTDTAERGLFLTMASLGLYSFYALGFPLFTYKSIVAFVDRSCAIGKGEWKAKPETDAYLIIYTIIDLLASIVFFGLFLYWYMSAENKSWVLLLPVIVLSLAVMTWIFGLFGLVYKYDNFLSVYCKRLLLLMCASTVCAIACLFVPTDYAVLGVFVLFWVLLTLFYANGTVRFSDKFIALRSAEMRREAAQLGP